MKQINVENYDDAMKELLWHKYLLKTERTKQDILIQIKNKENKNND